MLVFSDPGLSGATLDRPGLQAALRELRRGRAELFVCLDPDRLSRSLAHQLLLTEEIERAGARLEFVNFEWKDSPEGRLFYSLRGAISEYEREKIRERNLRGRWARARAGKVPGWSSCYGYDYDPASGTLAVNEAEAEVVRMVYRWFLEEDVGYAALASRLNSLGIPGKRKRSVWWREHHVYQMLGLEIYTGVLWVRRYQGPRRQQRPREEWIAVPVPPIVDLETWQAVQRKRAERSRLRRGWRNRYLLTGIAVCAVCGGPMGGSRLRKGWRYYRCMRATLQMPPHRRCPLWSGKRGGGQGKFVRADPVEELVWAAVCSWIENPEELARALRETLPEDDRRRAEEELRILEARAAALSRGRTAVLDLVRSGAVGPEEAEEELRRTRLEMEQIRRRREELSSLLSSYELAREEAEELLRLRRELGGILQTLPFEDRTAIIRLLVSKVVLPPGGKGRVVIHARIGPLESGREIPVPADLAAHSGEKSFSNLPTAEARGASPPATARNTH